MPQQQPQLLTMVNIGLFLSGQLQLLDLLVPRAYSVCHGHSVALQQSCGRQYDRKMPRTLRPVDQGCTRVAKNIN
ncbi:GL11714 [Drosophila persimilis]|uniref:GL11714 n=1 Tax=Drosophila persimilis TaxID=7234 RepID=B4GD83_DROPE|nr:GL11714 [Drosophila persimilis]